MNANAEARTLIWQLVLRSPLFRLIVLGAAMLQFMGWAQSWLDDYRASPLLSTLIQSVLGLSAIALYVACGKFVERRDVTEL